MAPDKHFGIVVFGATGFTGQYVIEYVAKSAIQAEQEGKTFKWAVAGRNALKLAKVLESASKNTGLLLTDIPSIVCDVSDELSMQSMTKQAKLVLNCVGPYRFSGEQVVKACLETKTHHVDISGEPQYLETMQLKYHEEAVRKGVYVVGACGFDSIPSDVGRELVHRSMEGPVNQVEMFLEVKNEGTATGPSVNFGTWQSLIHGVANAGDLYKLRRQLYPERMPKLSPNLGKRGFIHKSDVANAWCLLFPGADRSVMLRSERFRYHDENKRPAQVQAYVQCPSLFMAILSIFLMMIFFVLCKFSWGRYLLETYPRLFSFGIVTKAGPPKDVIENTNFTVTLFGKGWKNGDKTSMDLKAPMDRQVKVIVKGKNIGYGATCECMVQSAMVILNESERLPSTGGVLTPGYAFANTTIVERLHKLGVTFETEITEI